MRSDFTYQLCGGCYSGRFWRSLHSWGWASGSSHLQHAKTGWAERCKFPKSQWLKEWQVQMHFLETGIIVRVQSWHWAEKLASNSEGHSNSGFGLSSLPWETMPLCEAKTRKYVSLLTVKNQALDLTSNYCRIQIISTYAEEEKFGAVWKRKSCLVELGYKIFQIQIWFHPILYSPVWRFLVIDKDQLGFIAKFIL